MYDKLGGRSERLFGSRSPRAAWLLRKGAPMSRRACIGCRSDLRAAGGATAQLCNHNPRRKRGAGGVDIDKRRRPSGSPSMDHAVFSGLNRHRGDPWSHCRQRCQHYDLFSQSFCRDLSSLGREPNNYPGRSPRDRHVPNFPGDQKQQYRDRK
jgi:hypothetical protein